MKRGLTILLISVLLVNISLAVENTSNDSLSLSLESSGNRTASDIINELRGIAENESLQDLLRQENDTNIFTTPLPSILEQPTRIVFNIEDGEEVSLEKFVILIALILLVFFTMFGVLSLTVFSKTNSAIISLGMSIIIALTGIVPKIGVHILELFGKVNLTKTWIIIVVAIAIILYILARVLVRQKVQNKMTNSYKQGAKLRMGSVVGEKISEGLTD